MTQEIRFDSIKMPKVSKTKEGYLRGEVVVSRAGVFKYRNHDGSIRGELRHPENIFKPESLNTLKMIPITNNHPPVFVDSSNVHQYAVGYTGERYDVKNNQIIISITVTHADAIEAINQGKLELSMGYNVDCIKEDGTFEGETYHYRQLDPVYNHLAIVEKGRAGSEARFRFDHACESIETITQEQSINKEGKNMSDEGSQYRIDALNSENNALKTKNELLEVKLEQTQAKLKQIETSFVKAQEKLEAAEAIRVDSVIAEKANEKVSLIIRASQYLKDAEAYMMHSPREIMEAVIKHTNKDEDLSDKDDSYIRGKFDALVGAAPLDKRDHTNAFHVLKKHNDSVMNYSHSDEIFRQIQEIKQKRRLGK